MRHSESRKRKISAPGGAHRRTKDHAGAARARDSYSRFLSGSDLRDARLGRHIFDLQIASGLQIRAPRRSLEDDIAAAVPTGAHRTADDDLATAQLGKAANFLRHHIDRKSVVSGKSV